MREFARNRIWIVAIGILLLQALPSTLWGAEPHFKETEVFVAGQDAIHTYRIPSMVSTSDGTVLVFCEGRRNDNADGSPTDIVLKRSLGKGSPWSQVPNQTSAAVQNQWQKNIIWQPMQTLLRSQHGEAYMNPVPLIDTSDGTIFLLVNDYPPPYKDAPARIWLMKSHDEGASWSVPADITSSTGLKELGPGIGIQMDNGRLVVPTYNGVIFSNDHGKTWKSGEDIPSLFNETQVVELANGLLMLNIRQGGHRAIAISKDGGQTWGKRYTDKNLTDPKSYQGSQASIIRYRRKINGTQKSLLLFSNPANPEDRFDMTVRTSYDGGKTWPVSRRIKKGTGAYSCLTVLPDGTVGLVYETGNVYDNFAEFYGRISFIRFNLAWLTEGSGTKAN